MEKEVIEVNEEITEAIATDTGDNETAIADETTVNESTEQATATTDGPASECDGALAQDDADDSEGMTATVRTEAEVERLIAEAEARGYERGRNENIEAWMNEGRAGRQNDHEVAENEVMILNNMRRSVWE